MVHMVQKWYNLEKFNFQKEGVTMNLNQAVKILKQGGVIVYPTETCYGLGVNATNEKAIEKIFRIKKRDRGKPVSIIVADLKMAEKYCIIDEKTELLIDKFMPGPLTIVTEKKNLPGNLSKNTVGFRIPGHPIALELVKRFKKPITATSANISGEKPVYRMSELISIAKKADYVVYGGDLPELPPSTVYDAKNGKILRQGPIGEDEIKKAMQGL